MPPKVVLSDVVAVALVTPGPLQTTVLLVLVGIRVALEAVVHQLAVALSANVYVLVLTRSFDRMPVLTPYRSHSCSLSPFCRKAGDWASRRSRSDTSLSLIDVCLALKLTYTDDTVPVNPDTEKVMFLGSPPGLPQVGQPFHPQMCLMKPN